MALDDLRKCLVSESYLHPPIDIFESNFESARDAMLSILPRLEAFQKEPLDKLKLGFFLERIMRRNDLAFYGSALRDAVFDDIDLICLSPSAPPYPGPSKGLHIHRLIDGFGGESAYSGIYLSGALLFTSTPNGTTLELIQLSREQLLSAQFFDGGLGELITYAAFKAQRKMEETDIEPSNQHSKLAIRETWRSGACMMLGQYTPHQINNQLRSQMQGMEDKDLRELTMAAIKRLRVKAEKRAELSERFIKELRAKKVPG